MEEKDGEEKDAGEDDLDPHQGDGMEVAVDHDQLSGIPGYKGKDEESKDPVYHPPGVVVEDNQAEGQVDGKG